MTSRKISLDGTHKQIIDLNQDLVNFVVEFTITPQQSDMEKPYEIAITTQEKLDAGVEAKLTQVNGVFNKTIKNTTGSYQNYCLMISSKTEIKDITITINLTELPVEQPPAPAPPTQLQAQAPVAQAQAPPAQAQQQIQEPPVKDDTSKKFKIIVGVLVVIIGGCALYYFWNRSKKIEPVVLSPISSTQVPQVPIQSVPNPVLPSQPTTAKSPAFTFY